MRSRIEVVWQISDSIFAFPIIVGILTAAGGAFIANYFWSRYNTPSLSVKGTTPNIRHGMNNEHRHEIVVQNTGNKQAEGCQAELWLIGRDREAYRFFRLYQPLGWTQQHQNISTDPNDLDIMTIIPKDGEKSLYIGYINDNPSFVVPEVFNDDRYQLHMLDELAPGSLRYGLLLQDRDILFPETPSEPSVRQEFSELNEQFPNFSSDLPVDRRRDIPLPWFDNIDWIDAELTIKSDTTGPTVYYLNLHYSESSSAPFIRLRKKNRVDHLLEMVRDKDSRGAEKFVAFIEYVRTKRDTVQIPNGVNLGDYT